MTAEKVLEVIERYRGLFKRRGIDKISYPHANTCFDSTDAGIRLAHCHGMLDQMVEFVHAGRMEKASRWLGFVQGVLWTSGIYSLDDLKNHNRPTEEAQTDA